MAESSLLDNLPEPIPIIERKKDRMRLTTVWFTPYELELIDRLRLKARSEDDSGAAGCD